MLPALRGSGDTADLGPDLKGSPPGSSIVGGGDVIAAEREDVVDLIMGREEPLRLAGGLEALHLALAPPGRLVRILGPVVEALVPAVLDPGHHLPLRGGIARQLVRDQHARRPALLPQQLAADGVRVLALVWDNASWHISQEVRAWLQQHNRAVKVTGHGCRLLVCRRHRQLVG